MSPLDSNSSCGRAQVHGRGNVNGAGRERIRSPWMGEGRVRGVGFCLVTVL